MLSSTLSANISVTKVKYEGGISLFGRVAIADIVLEEDLDKNRYKMQVTASSAGIVKAMTSNRKDIFISEGDMSNGIYVPTKFTKLVLKDGYEEKTVYTFDYISNKVLKETYKEELVDDDTFNIIKMEVVSKKKTH